MKEITTYDQLVDACNEHGVDAESLAYHSHLYLELGKSYKPTISQLDDMYSGLVGGVIGNFHSGSKPEYIEGIGPDPEDRNTEESFDKLFFSIVLGLGLKLYPEEEWVKNSDRNEWVDIIEKGQQVYTEYRKDPSKWFCELRKNCETKFEYDTKGIYYGEG